jgi:hypothetical protein
LLISFDADRAPEWIRTDDPCQNCQNTMSIDIPPQAIRCTSLDEFESFLASAANRGADIAAFEVGLPKHPLLSASRHGLRGARGL